MCSVVYLANQPITNSKIIVLLCVFRRLGYFLRLGGKGRTILQGENSGRSRVSCLVFTGTGPLRIENPPLSWGLFKGLVTVRA